MRVAIEDSIAPRREVLEGEAHSNAIRRLRAAMNAHQQRITHSLFRACGQHNPAIDHLIARALVLDALRLTQGKRGEWAIIEMREALRRALACSRNGIQREEMKLPGMHRLGLYQ